MSHGYRAVGWTPHKRVYDTVLAGTVVLYLGLFVGIGLALDSNATIETQLIRALGTCALLLLHVVLAIGPLARLDRRFLPLLYNRRHLGVTMFLLALGHAVFGMVQFHALGNVNPLVSVLVSNPRYDSVSEFPFETLGLVALFILFAMAATSHDFWLANLTAPVWKSLHMLVYVAYALIVLHVALGVLQAERQPVLAGLLAAGLVTLVALHVVAGRREHAGDRACDRGADAFGFVEVCRLGDIREKRARIVTLGGERVAVFRYDGKVAAISNVCQHQNGPLGEGRIVDGCITCPWHGYQYVPETGASPPPFTEKVPTFRVLLDGDRVLVDPRPQPPGTRVEPALTSIDAGARAGAGDDANDDLYVGYLPAAPPRVARFLRRVVPALVAAAAAVAALLAVLQAPFDPGTFEFGTTRAVEGTIFEHPYPMLVEKDAKRGALLAREGKHGAAPDAAGLDGHRVRFEATRVESPLGSLLELVPATLEPATAAAETSPAPAQPLDRVELTGEIVDSKCFLGVMKPGRGKPHRSCAARCLAGGLPPALLVVSVEGASRLLLLADAQGGPLAPEAVLDLVGEPVTARGTVERRAGLLVLRLDDALRPVRQP